MAEPAGEFKSKRTGFTLTKTADGQIQQTGSYEGTATGFGAFFGTMTLTQPLEEAGANSGTCTWIAKAILEDKSILADLAEGTWERMGSDLRFKVLLNNNLSDGRKLRCEGVADSEAGTFEGQIYEI